MDQKQESNLILQRSVGGPSDKEFREVLKDPLNEFRVLGVIRQGVISEQGRQVPIFYLYNMKGTLIASEKDRLYLEENTAVKMQHKLREVAIEKWREDELEKARQTAEKPKEQSKETPPKGKKPNEGRGR